MGVDPSKKAARAREAEKVAAKCYFLLSYFEERSKSPMYRQLMSVARHGIADALERSHVAALKMGYSDLREKMEELPPGDRAELRHHLESLFGDDVDTEIQHDMVRAQQIVARGRISNDDEYAVLRTFLKHYAERWGIPGFIERATDLVAEYERTLE